MRNLQALVDRRDNGLINVFIVEDEWLTLTAGVHLSLENAMTWIEKTIEKIVAEGWTGEGPFEDVPDYYNQIMSISPEFGAFYGFKE